MIIIIMFFFFWGSDLFCELDFGLWRICFPPVLVRTGRRLPVQALGERGVLVSVTGYPRGGARPILFHKIGKKGNFIWPKRVCSFGDATENA